MQRNDLKAGFDIDGTLADFWYKKWTPKETWFLEKSGTNSLIRLFMCVKLYCTKPLLIPKGEIIIISSRPWWFEKITIKWLKKHNIKWSSIWLDWGCNLRPTLDLRERAKKKAYHIISNSVNIYYEDDKEIREELKKLCPNVKILPPTDAAPYCDFVSDKFWKVNKPTK